MLAVSGSFVHQGLEPGAVRTVAFSLLSWNASAETLTSSVDAYFEVNSVDR